MADMAKRIERLEAGVRREAVALANALVADAAYRAESGDAEADRYLAMHVTRLKTAKRWLEKAREAAASIGR